LREFLTECVLVVGLQTSQEFYALVLSQELLVLDSHDVDFICELELSVILLSKGVGGVETSIDGGLILLCVSCAVLCESGHKMGLSILLNLIDLLLQLLLLLLLRLLNLYFSLNLLVLGHVAISGIWCQLSIGLLEYLGLGCSGYVLGRLGRLASNCD
jgi:hypothetical protein